MVALTGSAARAAYTLRDEDEATIALPGEPGSEPGIVFMPATGTDGDDIIDILADTTIVDAGAGDDLITYSLDLSAGPGAPVASISGGDGDDTFDLSGLVLGGEDLGAFDSDYVFRVTDLIIIGGPFDVVVSMYEGAARTNFDLSDNGTIVSGEISGFETLIGSDYRDVLDGELSAILIDGGAGDDFLYTDRSEAVLIGGTGADIIFGTGATASYETALEGVRASLARNAVFGTGDADNNVLDGGLGNDRFVGGEGADSFIGGEGTDLVIYARSADGVRVNLVRGTATGGEAEGDTFSGIENVQGSQQSDAIIGNGEGNLLSGLGGDDILNGLGGNDNIVGGAGNDRLFGGDGGDALLGQSGNDRLFGGEGVDALYGGEGDDILSGGAGRDTLDGGSGFDTASYCGSEAGVVADLSGASTASDILRGIERVIGSEFDDTITGGSMTDILLGGGGDDVVSGGAGDDSLFGGAGADTLLAGAGRDFLTGGAGDDTFVVSSDDAGLATVLDFADGDSVDVSGLGADFDTFAEIQAAARNAGGTVVIDFGGSRLQILDMQIEDLTADMFDFGTDAVA